NYVPEIETSVNVERVSRWRLKLRRLRPRAVRGNHRSVLLFFALGSVLAGCSVISQVPVHSTAGQSMAEIERDEHECARAVKRRHPALASAGRITARGSPARVRAAPAAPERAGL